MTCHVSVVGGCGGAGSTMLAVALAIAAERLGRRVVIVDLDGERGDLATGLGAAPPRTVADLAAIGADLTAQHIRAASAVHPAGFAMIAGAPDHADLDMRALVDGLVGLEDAPMMVFDAGSGATAAAASLGRSCRTVLVCPTDTAGCRASRRTMRRLELAPGHARLVVNRGARPETLRPNQVARAHGLDIAAVLPHAPAEAGGLVCGVPRSGRRARIISAVDPLSRMLFGTDNAG